MTEKDIEHATISEIDKYKFFIGKNLNIERKTHSGRIFYYNGYLLDVSNNQLIFKDRKVGEMLIPIDEVWSVTPILEKRDP